jgi:hypothetical protein
MYKALIAPISVVILLTLCHKMRLLNSQVSQVSSLAVMRISHSGRWLDDGCSQVAQRVTLHLYDC